MLYPLISDLYLIYKLFPKISTDSRKVDKDSIFFALKGDSFNGNAFADKAIDSGASFVVIDEPKYNTNDKCILVKDVLSTLQELALYHRKQLTIPVIGITGTNGKTTTKELLTAALSEKYITYSTFGNLNNHIGVPLSILSIKNDVEIAVIEMGANHVGEIDFLCKIALPTHGLITNIGKAHLEGFGGFEGVIKAKTELYSFLNENNGVIFYNKDNEILSGYKKTCKSIEYSIKQPSVFTPVSIIANPLLEVEFYINNSLVKIKSQLIGEYNAENITAVLSISDFFNVPVYLIKQAVERYTPQNNRSQFLQTTKNKLIVDAYNANPTSMMAALVNFKQLQLLGKSIILGDMLELGNESLTEHKKIIDFIESMNCENVILVGPVFNQLDHTFKSFENTSEGITFIKNNLFIDKTILLKGSRGIGLEKMIEFL